MEVGRQLCIGSGEGMVAWTSQVEMEIEELGMALPGRIV